MNPIGNESILVHRPDVRYRTVGDEGIIVSQNDAEVLAVNEVGARLFSLIDGNRTLTQILEAMEAEFEVSRETLELDARSYISELLSTGVVEIETH